MSGGAGERMRAALTATRCYRLTGASPADWEVTACAAGIDGLEEEMDELLSDLFPATATEARLDVLEKRARPQPSTGRTEDRRLMAARSSAMNPGRFRREDLSDQLPAAGVIGSVQETETGLRVLAGRYLGLTEEELDRELDRLLPAHLSWERVREVNWETFDAMSPTFEKLDARKLTWSRVDNLTLALLENYWKKEEG